jgi:hypothetical protein
MAITLLEAAKIMSGETIRQSIIEEYAKSTDLMMALPFINIQGNAYKYNREDTLPGIGFRGLNESYSESTGILNPQTESLVIAGGDLDCDVQTVKQHGMSVRSVHESMKVKALGVNITNAFINGDSSTNPREFDGLKVRVTGTQLINNGATSGGDALSLAKLDQLIDFVENPTHLIMSRAMRRLLSQASRSSAATGFVMFQLNGIGQFISQYNGIPILCLDYNVTGTQDSILPFTEANPGGGTAASSSIYCVSFGDGKLVGLQNDVPEVRDLGELQTKPVYRTRVEWPMGISVMHGRAAARLQGIKNAAVVA